VSGSSAAVGALASPPRRPRSFGVVVAALLCGALLARPAMAQQPDLASVRGVVRDSAARPIALAQILVDGAFRATTDSAGRFALVDLAPGDIQLTVRRIGYIPLSIPLTLVEGGVRNLAIELTGVPTSLAPVVVEAERPGLFGTVVEEDGSPIPEAEVVVAGAGGVVTTRADGTFGVQGIGGRTYLVTVRRDGHFAARFSVDIPSRQGQQVRVQLQRLPDELTGSARRMASGFGTGDLGHLKDLDRRMRLQQAVLFGRSVLEPYGKRAIAEVFSPDRLLPVPFSQRGAGSIDPAGTTPNLGPPRGETCYFIDGAYDQSGVMAATMPAEWVESVEISREDHTGTLRGQVPRRKCGTFVVVWTRR
jgi:hypothetical protein